jgi:nitroimidazol reductase NimA-like FMN-containing flavoprotein (pyridoxamine 5'-phosphate oxidase superfamily)
MLVHELEAAECAAILQRTTLGRLGCSHDDQPYVVPIYFSYDVDLHCLYGFSSIGQKVRWMRHNPKVCVQVDEIEGQHHWQTVVVVGKYQEIHEDPLEADSRRRAEQLFQERSTWWLPGAAAVSDRPREHAVMFRITIERLTGRRARREERSAWF